MAAHVLVIEDNPANLELMTYLLGASGHTISTAVTGSLGLAAAGGARPDLIVCDVQLPDVGGYEVARQFKADPALRSIPLVAVTALAMVGDRDRVLAAGFDGYLAKPIDPETFVRQVETFLRPGQRTAPRSHAGAAAPAPPGPVQAGRTILVVDNQPVNLDLARSILEPSGWRVVTAGGMAEGLARAREVPCDLILSDVCMDGGTGYDFIRVVKADPGLRAIPFVFITSTALGEHNRAAGLALGADRFLLRPVEPDVLLAEIEACLRERGAS